MAIAHREDLAKRCRDGLLQPLIGEISLTAMADGTVDEVLLVKVRAQVPATHPQCFLLCYAALGVSEDVV